jgi:hypothetical protein
VSLSAHKPFACPHGNSMLAQSPCVFCQQDEIARLTRELAEAVEALKPFAAEESRWRDSSGTFTNDNVELWQRSRHDVKITVGDLRRASAIVEKYHK